MLQQSLVPVCISFLYQAQRTPNRMGRRTSKTIDGITTQSNASTRDVSAATAWILVMFIDAIFVVSKKGDAWI